MHTVSVTGVSKFRPTVIESFCQFHIKRYERFGSSVSYRVCNNCGIQLRLEETNYFVYIPIKQQIQNTFNAYFNEILSYKEKIEDSCSGLMADIHHGIIYQNILRKYQKSGIMPLSLALNTDGVKNFDNNVNSLWPVQIAQNFLPPNLRYLLKNIIVVALYIMEIRMKLIFFSYWNLCAKGCTKWKTVFLSFMKVRKLECCH